jgi:hypothetical protein
VILADVELLFARPLAAPGDLHPAPLLESWEAVNHPAQQRLRTYLDNVESLIGKSIPADRGHLTVELTVGLPEVTPLISGGRDLDNYLMPVARRIGAGRLDAVFGRKHHATTSTITAACSPLVND